MFTRNIKLLDAATATITTTSAVGATFPGAVDVSQRQLKSIQFLSTNMTTGTGVFTVWVSNDGLNFVKYNRLNDNVTNSNSQTDTRVASSTLSATARQKIYFFPQGDYFASVMASVTVTTDGSYTAILQSGE